MVKKITSKLYGLLIIIQLGLYLFGIGCTYESRDEIGWLIASILSFFVIGSIPSLLFITKKGRKDMIESFFSSIFISESELFKASAKKVYWSIKKDDIIEIAIGRMPHPLPGMFTFLKFLVVKSKAGMVARIRYSRRRKKILEAWLLQPIKNKNIVIYLSDDMYK